MKFTRYFIINRENVTETLRHGNCHMRAVKDEPRNTHKQVYECFVEFTKYKQMYRKR